MFKRIPGVPYEEKVAGVIGYNKAVDNFDVMGSTNPALYKQEVEQLIKETRNRSARLQAEIEDMNQRKYDKAIREADYLFRLKKYSEAMNRYRDAVFVKESEDYPRKKVNECYEIIVKEEILSTIGAPSEETILKIVENGDQMMKKYEYSMAKVSYEMALTVASDNPEIKKKYESALAEVKKLEELGKTEREHNTSVYQERVEKYNELIDNGDAALKELEFAKAQHYYAMAATQINENSYTRMMLKKVEEMVNNEISSLESALARENETKTQLRNLQETAYLNAIADADRLYQEKKYADALTKYSEASKIKTFEMYPKDQIRKVKDIMNDIKMRGDKYNDLMAQAKVFQQNGIYDTAIKTYQEAHNLIPSETEAIAKIEEVRTLQQNLEHQAEIDNQYTEAIKNADQRFHKQDYINAIKYYEEASSLKPDEDYPSTQIERINIEIQVLDDLKKVNEDYNEYITQADELFRRQQYEYARDFYERAQKLKSEEKYPIAQLEKIVVALENKRKQEQIDIEYAQLVADADNKYMDNQYKTAIEVYKQAEKVKPSETYPRLQIERIQATLEALEKQEQLNTQYNSVILLADGQLKNGSYDLAEVTYRKAQSIKPDEQYPKDKIQEIWEIRQELERQKKLDQEFSDYIAKGDDQRLSKDYDMAVISFKKALEIKPDDVGVQNKIDEVNELIHKEEEIKLANRKYETLVKFGDQLYDSRDLKAAIESYQSALEIKPLENYPRQQIAMINEKIKAIEAVNQSYAMQLRIADELFQNKSYSSAIASYQKAQSIKPNDTYPAIQIEKITNLMREKQAEERIEAQYSLHVSEGDEYFMQKKFDAAIKAYQDALLIKPSEDYPRERVMTARDELAKLEQDNLDKQYETTISIADQFLENKDYDAAIEAYNSAGKIKPGKNYSNQQIQLINELIRKQNQRENEYALYIKQADEYFNTTKYNQALVTYQKASEIKPQEDYPIEQLRKIKNVLSRKDHIAQEFTNLQNTYAEVVQKGDALYRSTEYEKARAYYQHASYLLPEKDYPKQQINKINAVGSLKVGGDTHQVLERIDLSDVNKISPVDREEAYKEAKTLTEKFMTMKEFELAKFYYNRTMLLDPKNTQAKSIIELDELYKDQGVDVESYFDMVSKAENALDNGEFSVAQFYFNKAKEAKPDDNYAESRSTLADRMAQISNQREDQKTFDQSIKKGDAAFNSRNYSVAKFFYRKALNLNVNNSIAQKKLSQVETVLEKLEQVNPSSDYTSLIEKGDRSVTLKRYAQAIDYYEQALEVMPDKDYPKQQIERIKSLLGE